MKMFSIFSVDITATWVELTLFALCVVCLLVSTVFLIFMCCSWSKFRDKQNKEMYPMKLGQSASVKGKKTHFLLKSSQNSSPDYGSLGEQGFDSKTSLKRAKELTDRQRFTYATLKLHCSKPHATANSAYLKSIEPLNTYFHIKDLYLELRNCLQLDPQGIDILKVVSFNKSINKMRRRFELTHPVLISTKSAIFEPEVGTGFQENTQIDQSATSAVKANFAKLFYKSNSSQRHYVATGSKVSCVSVETQEKNGVALNKAESESTAETLQNGEAHVREFTLTLSFLHDKMEPVGRVKVSLAYLPTAEKLTIHIDECELRKSLLAQYTHVEKCYWKLNLLQKHKRLARRRTPTIDLHPSLSWHNFLVTFDWLAREDINTFSVLFTLIGQRKDTPTSSAQQENQAFDGNIDVNSNTENVHQTLRIVNRQDSLEYADVHSVTSHDSLQSDDSQESSSVTSLSPRSSRKSDKYEILGEIGMGSSVPERKCVGHWQSMLLQPRQIISGWQDIY